MVKLIQVEDHTHKALMQAKLDSNHKSVNAVIEDLFERNGILFK